MVLLMQLEFQKEHQHTTFSGRSNSNTERFRSTDYLIRIRDVVQVLICVQWDISPQSFEV